MNYKEIFKISALGLVLLGIIVIDIIAIVAINKVVDVLSDAILGGIIGFVGALIGGAITYFGVSMQLHHRKVENFLLNAQERLNVLSGIMPKYNKYLNRLFVYQYSQQAQKDKVIANEALEETAREFLEEINKQSFEISRALEYKDAKLFNVYLKFLNSKLFLYTHRKDISDSELTAAVEDIRSILGLLKRSNDTLEEKYRKYHKQYTI
ncbi:hypothetical protein CHH91_04525 [Virgibacillus sp. 7505]|uniref:hypothetical protein n=1 Tax=Virgibacillus sp. 7505 TaxID=2022548 RepID=UPI000BA66D94|nr:hypothetical protein [Virgibacillus sp. 7505]PAE17277.1 hypothetical protein CHH91_04525 [Virgibacillus sp. 7505]